MGLSRFCSRLLFGLVLSLVSIKGFYDIDSNKGFVSQNIRLLSEKLQKYNINRKLLIINFCNKYNYFI